MSLDDELWRRAQSRREATMGANLSEADQMILPLMLSLARLAAQQDVQLRQTLLAGEPPGREVADVRGSNNRTTSAEVRP